MKSFSVLNKLCRTIVFGVFVRQFGHCFQNCLMSLELVLLCVSDYFLDRKLWLTD